MVSSSALFFVPNTLTGAGAICRSAGGSAGSWRSIRVTTRGASEQPIESAQISVQNRTAASGVRQILAKLDRRGVEGTVGLRQLDGLVAHPGEVFLALAGGLEVLFVDLDHMAEPLDRHRLGAPGATQGDAERHAAGEAEGGENGEDPGHAATPTPSFASVTLSGEPVTGRAFAR